LVNTSYATITMIADEAVVAWVVLEAITHFAIAVPARTRQRLSSPINPTSKTVVSFGFGPRQNGSWKNTQAVRTASKRLLAAVTCPKSFLSERDDASPGHDRSIP
jgi:hypothetical protein